MPTPSLRPARTSFARSAKRRWAGTDSFRILLDFVEHVHFRVQYILLASIMPMDCYFFNLFVLAQAEGDRQLGLREVAAGGGNQPFLHRAVDDVFDPSAVGEGILAL